MILLITAIVLAIILFPIGFIFSMFYSHRRSYLFKIALGIDQLGNVVCAHLFNAILIKKTGPKFGNEDETISSVLGKNKKIGTLTKLGRALDCLLEKIDKNHSIDSIESDEALRSNKYL